MTIFKNMYNQIVGSTKEYIGANRNVEDAFGGTKSEQERQKLLDKAAEGYVKTIPSIFEGTRDNAIKELGKDYPQEPASQKLPTDKRSERSSQYQKLFTDNYRSEADILFKPLKDSSEDQIVAARNYAVYDGKDPSLNSQIRKKVSDWYDYAYSTNPVKRDATGRMISPQPSKKTNSGRPRSLDGFDMNNGLRGLSEIMSELEEKGATGSGVISLQKAMNSQGISPQLKEDGILGEKTALQTRKPLAEKGYNILARTLRG